MDVARGDADPRGRVRGRGPSDARSARRNRRDEGILHHRAQSFERTRISGRSHRQGSGRGRRSIRMKRVMRRAADLLLESLFGAEHRYRTARTKKEEEDQAAFRAGQIHQGSVGAAGLERPSARKRIHLVPRRAAFESLLRSARAATWMTWSPSWCRNRASAVSTGQSKTSRASSAQTQSSHRLPDRRARPARWRILLNSSTNTALDGEGTTSRQTTLTTTISARVTHVLVNGNLVVEGTRNLNVNSENQIITIRGVIRPIDLDTTNTVLSARLAQHGNPGERQRHRERRDSPSEFPLSLAARPVAVLGDSKMGLWLLSFLACARGTRA